MKFLSAIFNLFGIIALLVGGLMILWGGAFTPVHMFLLGGLLLFLANLLSNFGKGKSGNKLSA